MKILVFAPHPDDEVLGCGATIAKYNRAGHEVYLCIATKAYEPEWSAEYIKAAREQAEESAHILGIEKTYFLDLLTVKLDAMPQKDLNDAVSRVVDEVRPDVLYVPFKGDINKDHRLIFEAALVAARPKSGYNVKRILSYEVLSETDWSSSLQAFIPNKYEDVTQDIGVKLEALKAYKSELRQPPHPRSLEIVESLAKKRGSEAGVGFAEAFMLIREVS